MTDDFNPFVSIKPPVNRSDKRKIKHEVIRNWKFFDKLLNRFYSELFTEGHGTYIELYKHYCAQYIEVSKALKERGMLKVTGVDLDMFREHFKPLEHEA